ncbi:TIR domain-containing protein [Aestuariivivens marinum]|uniref:TIR domain-containing protein n=1 Tax=Aestuariivivens marinum TaxID=2913555 RepID=UPI001F56513A|nr:nucleotide-binding protein [Aestuariivivens marinum]
MSKKKTTPKSESSEYYLVKPYDQIKSDLIDRIEIGKELSKREVNNSDQLNSLLKEFRKWDVYNLEYFKRVFNDVKNQEAYKYSSVNNVVGLMDVFKKKANVNSFVYRLKDGKTRINNLIEFLENFLERIDLIPNENDQRLIEKEDKVNNHKGFIVHGHNDQIKLEVSRYIEKTCDLETIILHEEANEGKTVIEKFEKYSDVDFAVALWTADDVGKSKKSDEYNYRARQNVIFETGYFIGKLGRNKVIILYEAGVEIPSDYNGVIYIEITGNWKDYLRREIEAIYSN